MKRGIQYPPNYWQMNLHLKISTQIVVSRLQDSRFYSDELFQFDSVKKKGGKKVASTVIYSVN